MKDCPSCTEEKTESTPSMTSTIPKVATAETDDSSSHSSSSSHHTTNIILFYKYHSFSSCKAVMEPYRLAMEKLCRSLDLKGRILLGCSETEGINGTLAGKPWSVRTFTLALLGRRADYQTQQQKQQEKNTHVMSNLTEEEAAAHDQEQQQQLILEQFWEASREWSISANLVELTMDSPDDFKWSSTTRCQDEIFPDLVVKLVPEIIGTGGVLASIPLEETAKGYLTPQEWHDELLHLNPNDTVLIDCRNAKECAIGHFPNALDPKTTTFHQFPQWADTHAQHLKDKRVLMYCTGGIRCEKASAYLRKRGVPEVQHLKGGNHKYLEQYGKDGLWRGKNFVFDGRGAASAQETQLGRNGGTGVSFAALKEVEKEDSTEDIVGSCLYCSSPYDTFHPHCVCTVCREPTLVCGSCQERTIEYHCTDHYHLRTCYFTNLARFSNDELSRQLEELQQHVERMAVGKRFRQKRKTLYKQCEKIQKQMVNGNEEDRTRNCSSCRNCGQGDCNGACWGFHGLERKQLLDKQTNVTSSTNTGKGYRSGRPSAGQRVSKQLQRQRAIEEIQELQLSQPSSKHWSGGIRVPPPCTRVLQTIVKGKWCGRPVVEVLQTEFADLAKPNVLKSMMEEGLLRLNGHPLTNENAYTKLRNMDVISRVLHWHEPPVQTPEVISVQKLSLPEDLEIKHDTFVYVCDKPSSVPVHPAGPYLSNTLTMMVEAQEKLDARSLIPCHRIDRATSGLTICCADARMARIIQGKIDEGCVRKLYVARVKGEFPLSSEEAIVFTESSSFAKWSWNDTLGCVEVDAPIETMDAGNGVRIVSAKGKASRSRFQFLAHDPSSNSSLVACAPLTGRGHQLRVHLQWLGFPIDGDLGYGGRELEANGGNGMVVQRMLSVLSEGESCEGALNSISSDDARAARLACLCCKNGAEGIISSFTQAQLLHENSTIYLHALRYELSFPKRKRKVPDVRCELTSTLTMEVPLPNWALEFGSVQLGWLQLS